MAIATRAAAAIVVLALAGGCAIARSGLGDAPANDAGVDAGAGSDGSASTDAGRDGGRDGGADGGRDGGRDGGADGGRDGGLDGGRDAMVDACLGVCAPGITETEPCGNCGTRSRTCTPSCTWGAWDACTDEGECAPGTVESSASCGLCGTSQRACRDDCTWGGLVCTGEGVCSPGTTATTSCGRCSNGAQTRTCTTACTWSSSGTCTGEVYCTYGAIVRCPGEWSSSWQCCDDGDWEMGGC